MTARRIEGVSPYGGADLVVEAEFALVKVTAGSGYDSGSTYLTPGQARTAASLLTQCAAEAEAQGEEVK